MEDSFDSLMLIGRAGAGKSEFIDFLKHVDEASRPEKFHVGAFEEVDDFPWLFSLFQEEDLWEELGYPRKFSKKNGKIYDTVDFNMYKFLTLKFNLVLKKKYKERSAAKQSKTFIIEYARGRDDAYRIALDLFDVEILKRTAIFFLDNTFEESMRRNTVRSAETDANQTILHHKVPLDVMEGYYKTHDWYDLTHKKPDGYVQSKGASIPFVTVWNIPESHDDAVLAERYGPALKRLWELNVNRPKGE